jgi:hypothetical protein
MPRPRTSNPLRHAVDGLVGAMNGLLETLGAAGPKLPVEMRHAPGEAAGATTPKQRGPGKGNPRLKAALKKSWGSYTPKQRAERVRKMLAGRGLKPKGVAKKATRAKPTGRQPAARKAGGAWASMTPEQRAERVAKMRAGGALRRAAELR